MSFLSTAVQTVLEEGPFCAVATMTPRGPHCTPLVFAYSGGRLWLTTSRGSVKARAWKVDPGVSGMIRHGAAAVTFTGTVTTYDALDRASWGSAVSGVVSITRATAKFSRKNARFFAGYAMDARQVPLAWMPPGRVFVAIDIERTALLEDDGVQEGRGRWGGEVASHATFRGVKKGADPLAALPNDLREELGRSGDGALTVLGARGPVVLPVHWRAEAVALYAALPAETLALAGVGPDAAVSLTVDKPSAWRARDMVGAMVQGTGACYVGEQLGSGVKTVRALAADMAPGADAIVRVSPSRLVWWKGWSGGSAVIE